MPAVMKLDKEMVQHLDERVRVFGIQHQCIYSFVEWSSAMDLLGNFAHMFHFWSDIYHF